MSDNTKNTNTKPSKEEVNNEKVNDQNLDQEAEVVSDSVDTDVNTEDNQDTQDTLDIQDIVNEELSTEEIDEANESLSDEVDSEEVNEEVVIEDNMPSFRSGDTVRVFYKIIEGNKTRIQPYEGIVIAMKGHEKTKTFTVRRIGADGIGVERIFPLFSPNIEKIILKKSGRVRRSKLYYLRDKVGRAAMRIKERKAK